MDIFEKRIVINVRVVGEGVIQLDYQSGESSIHTNTVWSIKKDKNIYSDNGVLITTVTSGMVHFYQDGAGGSIGWFGHWVSVNTPLTCEGVNLTTIEDVGDYLLTNLYTIVPGSGGSGAVDSVNGQIGTVTLTPSDISDALTTRKWTNATEKNNWNSKQDALVSGTNIKTINGSSILGSGNLALAGVSNLYNQNNITFINVIGDYFGTIDNPRTGTLTFDTTDAVRGGISIVYYNNTTLDIPTTWLTLGTFAENQLNKLYFERDGEGYVTCNIINLASTTSVAPTNLTLTESLI